MALEGHAVTGIRAGLATVVFAMTAVAATSSATANVGAASNAAVRAAVIDARDAASRTVLRLRSLDSRTSVGSAARQ